MAVREGHHRGKQEAESEEDDDDDVAEETKESVNRFESLRQELSSSEFKKSLLNHHQNEKHSRKQDGNINTKTANNSEAENLKSDDTSTSTA